MIVRSSCNCSQDRRSPFAHSVFKVSVFSMLTDARCDFTVTSDTVKTWERYKILEVITAVGSDLIERFYL